MNFSFLEKIIADYFQKHPEVIEQLIDALVKRLLSYLSTPNQ